MGESFDGENNSDTVEEKLKNYKTKKLLLSLYSKLSAAKLDYYVVKPFVLGTARKNLDKRLILERIKKLYITTKLEILNKEQKRLLILDDKFDEAYTFSGIMGEFKYWCYFISWIWKVVSMFMIIYILHVKKISVSAIKIIRL